MEGTELLTALKETIPKMVKIIMTGFPALENAARAINKGVDGFFIKPVNTDELLRFVKAALDMQRHESEYTQEKVAQFVETRVKELQTEELNT
jgi:DNA-binding NtrC family response regulator